MQRLSLYILLLLIIKSLLSSCSSEKSNKGQVRSTRTHSATLEGNDNNFNSEESNTKDLEGEKGATKIENNSKESDKKVEGLHAFQEKPFDEAFPEVKDRLFIDSLNNTYYDFKREDGKWDLEENGKELEAEDEIFHIINHQEEDVPNLLFPAHLGIKFVQPARLANGLVILFFIDKDKNLKAITQVAPQSNIWMPLEKAQQIDKNIELVFPIKNPEGKIDVVYIKSHEGKQIALKRTLSNEEEILLLEPEAYADYAEYKSIRSLFEKVKESLQKSGIMLVSLKQIDQKIAAAISEGLKNPEPQESSETSSGEEGAHLIGIGDGYKDGGMQKAWTGEGSIGQKISSKENWDPSNPTALCSNIATTIMVATVVSTGPVSGVMLLGMASGLKTPEEQLKEQASESLSLDEYANLRVDEAIEKHYGTADKEEIKNELEDELEVPIPELDEEEYVELSQDDINKLIDDCKMYLEEENKSDSNTEASEKEKEAVHFCLDFIMLENIQKDQETLNALEAAVSGRYLQKKLFESWKVNSFKSLLSLPFRMTFAAASSLVSIPFMAVVKSARFINAGIKENFKIAYQAGKIKDLEAKSKQLQEKLKQKGLSEEAAAKLNKQITDTNTKITEYQKMQKINKLEFEMKGDQKKLSKANAELEKIKARAPKNPQDNPWHAENQASKQKQIDELNKRIAANKSELSKLKADAKSVKWQKIKTSFKKITWSSIKVPFKLITFQYARKNLSRARRSGVKGGVKTAGVATIAGGIASYDHADDEGLEGKDKAKQAAEDGTNMVVESPLAAAEGANAIHSTAGSLCTGNIHQVLKNVANMTAGVAHGIVDLTDGLAKMICDGVSALDKGKDGDVAKGICTAMGWVSWAADNILHPGIDGAQKGVNAAADYGKDVYDDPEKELVDKPLDEIGKGFRSIFLVDPQSGTVFEQPASKSGLHLSDPMGTFYCLKDPRVYEDPQCFDANPYADPKAQPVEMY